MTKSLKQIIPACAIAGVLLFAGSSNVIAQQEPVRHAAPHAEKIESMSKAEARAALGLMKAQNVTLAKAIESAEKHSNGRAVMAKCCVSDDDTKTMVHVCCLDNNDQLQMVEIDLASNQVVAMNVVRDSGITRDRSLGDASGGIARAANIIGTNVYNRNDESIGEIHDLAIDPARGRIAYAVLSYGGVMGIKDKLFAVPWSAISMQTSDRYILDLDQTKLKNAPGFDKNNWPNMADVKFAQDVHAFYSQQPYWENEGGDATAPPTTISPVYKASDFLNRDVENAKGEDLGDIEDLAISPGDGTIAYAVLSYGGWLGINDKLFAIPWDALAHTSDGKCQLNVDKDRLKNAPGFNKDNWPNMADPAWRQAIRDYYPAPKSSNPSR
jgi:sporulation protein YlmC with PRC-barrel domain